MHTEIRTKQQLGHNVHNDSYRESYQRKLLLMSCQQ